MVSFTSLMEFLEVQKPLYDYILKVYCGQILSACGEQFREPQDGP
jgi:hypothetical protein